MTSHDDRFTRPLYTVAEAARLVGMSPSTLSTWVKGYQRRFSDRPPVNQGPVVTSLPARHPHGATVPFVGLVEATVVQAFRRTQLPMQRVRAALRVLGDQGELDHPLASKRLYTDGAQVLFDYAEGSSDGQLRLLTVVSSGQRVFHEVVRDYLQRIHFDDNWASELIVPVTERELLRVRPAVASGDPLFVHGGAPLRAVIARYRAGESIESLAYDYGVPGDEIEEVLRDLRVAAQAA